MTSEEMYALAERLADVMFQRFVRQQAARKAKAARRRRQQMQHRLETLGTPKFKPTEGLYRSIAEDLGIHRRYVYSVAKGVRTSPRVLKALREEIALRAAAPKGGAA